MKSLIAVSAVTLCLTVQPGRAMDPDEAGRQGRGELQALMTKQRAEQRAATEKTADNTVPAPVSKAADRRATKAIDNRVPAICRGC